MTQSWSPALKRGLKKLPDERKRLENRREKTEQKNASESENGDKTILDQFRDKPARERGSAPAQRDRVRGYVEKVLPKYIEAKAPEGIIYILEIIGVMAGMGALRKLEEGVGEIKRVYVRPEHRGKGYGKEMLSRLMAKAEEIDR